MSGRDGASLLFWGGVFGGFLLWYGGCCLLTRVGAVALKLSNALLSQQRRTGQAPRGSDAKRGLGFCGALASRGPARPRVTVHPDVTTRLRRRCKRPRSLMDHVSMFILKSFIFIDPFDIRVWGP